MINELDYTGSNDHSGEVKPLPPAEGASVGKAIAYLVIVLVLMRAIATLVSYSEVPFAVDIWCQIVLIISLIPMVRWYQVDRRSMPFFEILCFDYGFQSSIPIYMAKNYLIIQSAPVTPSAAALEAGLQATGLGLVALIAGFKLANSIAAAKPVNLVVSDARFPTFVSFGVLCILAEPWLTTVQGGSLGSLVRLAVAQGTIAIVLVAYKVVSPNKAGRAWLPMLIGMVAVKCLVGFSTGMLEAALLPLALVAIVVWHAKQKPPYALIMVGATLFVLGTAVKAQFRESVWTQAENASFTGRVKLWYELATGEMQTASEAKEPDAWREPFQRLDLIHRFGYVMDCTPRVTPFLGGLSYEYFKSALVPRMFWPDKPTATAATDLIDFTYAFRTPGENDSTNIGVGILTESWANFGLFGVFLVMAVQGAIFGVLNGKLNGPNSVGGRAIYLANMIFFLNGISSTAVMFFGALAQNVIAEGIMLAPFCPGTPNLRELNDNKTFNSNSAEQVKGP